MLFLFNPYIDLLYDQLSIIWECLSPNDVRRNFLYLWLLDQIKNPQRAAVDLDTVADIVKQKVYW